MWLPNAFAARSMHLNRRRGPGIWKKPAGFLRVWKASSRRSKIYSVSIWLNPCVYRNGLLSPERVVHCVEYSLKKDVHEVCGCEIGVGAQAFSGVRADQGVVLGGLGFKRFKGF